MDSRARSQVLCWSPAQGCVEKGWDHNGVSLINGDAHLRTAEWTELEEVGSWGGDGVCLLRVWFLAPGFSSLPCFLG